MEVTNKRSLIFTYTVSIIAVIWCLFQLYTAYNGILPALQQRSLHLLFALLMIFLSYSYSKKNNFLEKFTFEKVVLFLLTVWSVGYIVVNHISIWTNTGALTPHQSIISLVIILLILEAARRVTGWALPIIALISILYAMFGKFLGGIFQHQGYTVTEIFSYQVMSLEGVFGVALAVASTFVFLFIFYAKLLEVSGGGQVFIDLAIAIVGKVRGGPAKIAVVSSAMFGSISGSAVANVAGTGTFTIPLMKKTGYSSRFAGSVEAVSSTGGQLMPPIMGAAAFLIAEVLGIPFSQVVLAAIVPAVLYYTAIFIMVDLEAAKNGIKGMEKQDIPKVKDVLAKGWHLLISPVVLVFLLIVLQWSPMLAAFWSIIVTFLATFINPKNRMTLKKTLESMKHSAMGSIETSIACATVGIVIGVIMQTGIGYAISSIMVSLAGGSLLLLLLFTMLASLVLGMGLPTVAAYLVLSVIVAPNLEGLGIYPLAAHLFIFYFGIISAITPPVALASFVAAGLSGDRPLNTSLTSLRLGLSAFILPFMFVYNPALLLHGEIGDIILTIATATFGIFLLSIGLQRYFKRSLNIIETIIIISVSILLISPEYISDIIAIGVLILFIGFNYIRSKIVKLKTSNIDA